jgi:DNA-binding NtrC family response regulator
MPNSSPVPRVLVVDDELLIRWSLGEALTAAGYTVVEGRDAAEARRAIGDQVHPPDVVVLDYRLPDSDDLGLLSAIRREAPTVPVILMTAHGTAEVVKGALDLGAYRVVSKPFEVHEMASLVTQALAAR